LVGQVRGRRGEGEEGWGGGGREEGGRREGGRRKGDGRLTSPQNIVKNSFWSLIRKRRTPGQQLKSDHTNCPPIGA
jgi:hypothetical protein